MFALLAAIAFFVAAVFVIVDAAVPIAFMAFIGAGLWALHFAYGTKVPHP
jgi:hypothetical protein